MSEHGALRHLAEVVGLLPGYHATSGAWIEATDEDLLATLQAYGIDIDDPADADRRREDLEQRRRAQLIEPVLVAWDGRPPIVELPGDGSDAGDIEEVGNIELRLEAGTVIPIERVGEVLALPRLPLGRHELIVHTRSAEHVATIFSAPTMAWRPPAGAERRWGIFVPTYALWRTSEPSAIGDLADLEAAFDWLHRAGGQVVVTLPMLAAFLDDPAGVSPAGISPYAPVSRRFWNELFADVRALAERSGTDLGTADDRLVDHRAAWAPRRMLLANLAERLRDDPDLDRWRLANPLVDEYARFRAAGVRHGRDWRRWPARLPTDVDPADVRFHRTAQWLMDRQLERLHRKTAARRQLLALDLPVGSHPDGFDVWRERDLFVEGVSVGAPPDSFFTLGQDWGFPPVHPQRSREQGHRFLQECIRHHVRHAGLLRVDHILGLLRLYWVRAGAGAGRGVYVRYPLDELLAVISLEAARAGAVVVGENLGTVPPEVTEAMTGHGILGCAVAQFDVHDVLDPGRPLPVPSASTVATLNTHDTATFAGFWSGADADDRAALGLLDEAALAEEHRQRAALRDELGRRLGLDAEPDAVERPTAVEAAAALLAVAADSDAALVVLNVEDGWAEPHPQNVPGTVEERPNWRRRAQVAIDGWNDDAGLQSLVDAVRGARPGWGPPEEASDGVGHRLAREGP